MKTRLGLLLAACLLALPGGARPGERGMAVPVEWYLPARPRAFLSLPDARSVLEVLAAAGEDRAAFAKRLAARARAKPAEVEAVIGKLLTVMDGPVTVSFHREAIPGAEARTVLLASAFSSGPKEALGRAADDLVRVLLGPMFAKRSETNTILGKKVVRLTGGSRDLYLATGQGHLLVSTSPLLLGRVLKEIQSPSIRTLYYDESFKAARKAMGATDRDGFLYVRDPEVLPFAAVLGETGAAGVLARDGDGFRDRVLLFPGEAGLLGALVAGGKVPRSWAGAGGAWLGAALGPGAAAELALALLGRENAAAVADLGEAAAGPVEILARPGRAPLLRVVLSPDADPAAAAAPLGRLGRVSGRSLLISPEEVPAGAPAVGREVWDGAGSALLKAPVPFLLSLLHREGARGGGTTAWTFAVTKAGIAVSSGRSELGPFQAAVAALIR